MISARQTAFSTTPSNNFRLNSGMSCEKITPKTDLKYGHERTNIYNARRPRTTIVESLENDDKVSITKSNTPAAIADEISKPRSSQYKLNKRRMIL